MGQTGKGIAEHISAEDLVGPRWAEWYALTPAERMRESAKLWPLYLALGGSLDPDPDPQSPFYDGDAAREGADRPKAGVDVTRRR